jgi:sulfotransferase family protein
MSRSAAKLIASGSALQVVRFGAGVAVAFFLTPFVIHSLGDRMYGFWALAAVFIGYYGVMDLGLGCRRKPVRGRGGGAAAMWVGHVRAVREAVSELGPGRFHEIRYEELSRSPALTLRQCADFLGLKWEDAEIASALEMNQAAKARAKGGGTPIPLFGDVAERSGPTVIEPKGFVRRGKPGGWREDLSLYQQFRAWRIAHQEMEAVGYHWDKPRRLIFASVSALADLMKGRRMLPAARSLALGYFAALVQYPSICDMFDLLS